MREIFEIAFEALNFTYMKANYLTLILQLYCCFNANSQVSDRYHKIDSLLSTGTTTNLNLALQDLKQKLPTDASRPDYWIMAARANSMANNKDEAMNSIRRAVSLDTRNPETYFEKGLLYNDYRELDTAIQAFEQAIAIQPDGKYFYWKGIVNQQRGRNDIAESDYRAALARKFETAELYNNLAILVAYKENFEEAVQVVNKALALNSGYSQALSARARFYLLMGNVELACSDGSKAFAMGYKNAFVVPDSICNGNKETKLRFVADVIASNELWRLAVKAYDQLIVNKFLSAENFMNRGYCYFKLNDYVNAEKDYLQALSFPMNNSLRDLLYDNLSVLYYKKGNSLASIEYSTKRIELNPNNHVPYIDRGLNYRTLKKYKEAEADFNRSLAIKPDFHRAFGYRANLYLELGQYEKALEDASKAVQINQRYGFGYLARAKAKRGLKISDFCLDLLYAQKYGEAAADILIKEFCH